MTKIKVENIGKAETPPNSEQGESDNEVAEPVETKNKRAHPKSWFLAQFATRKCYRKPVGITIASNANQLKLKQHRYR